MDEEGSVATVHAAPLSTRILQGAGLTLGMTAFRLMAGPRSSSLTAFHLAVLTLIVGLAGGVGGAAYYALDGLRSRGGWRKTYANVLSLLAYAGAAIAGVVVAGVWLLED